MIKTRWGHFVWAFNVLLSNCLVARQRLDLSQTYTAPCMRMRHESMLQDGWTPLHFAAYGGALEVTQFLLVKGANPELRDTVSVQQQVIRQYFLAN